MEHTPAQMQAWMEAALAEAEKGIASGGMPFGAVMVMDGKIVARGHNRQIQDDRFLAHAETECLNGYFAEHPGPLKGATLVATEAPCPMCAGAAVVAGIRRLIVGETHHYRGAYDWLIEQGVEVSLLDDQPCIDLVTDFRTKHADRWLRYSAG